MCAEVPAAPSPPCPQQRVDAESLLCDLTPPPASSLPLNLNLHLTAAHMWHTCSSISQRCLASHCSTTSTSISSSCSYNPRYQHTTTSEPPPPLLHLHTMKTSPPLSAAVRPETSLSLQGHTHTRSLTRLHMQKTHTHIHAAPPPPPPGAHACLCCTPSIQNSSAQLIVCLTPVRSCPLKSQRICKPFVFCFFSSPVLPAMCGEQSSCGKKRREKEKQDAERMLQTRAERSSEPGPYREKQAETLWAAAAAAAGAEGCSAHTPRDHRGQPAVWSTDGHKQRAERTRSGVMSVWPSVFI